MKNITIIKGNIAYTKTLEKFEIHEDSFIVAKDGKIEGIYADIPSKYRSFEIEDYGDRIIIPGFVDLHVHAAQYMQSGIGMTRQLLEWLNDYTYNLERKFQDEEFAEMAYEAFADKLLSVGTLRSCIFASSSTKGTQILFEALRKKGLGAYVGKVNMDTNAPGFIIESTKNSIEGTKQLIEMYKGEGLVKPIITPRFAPTSTKGLLKELGDLAVKYGIPVQSHVNENREEMEWVREIFPDNKSYIDVYDSNSLFGQTPTVMAHAIYLEEEEIEYMREKGVFIAHCPDSNINVRSGIMPLRKYIDRGLKIGLGSDVAGGHKIGMNEAIVRAVQLSKILNIMDKSYRPVEFSEAFYIGTKGGGEFFGNTGSFEDGYSLDALVIEDEKAIAQNYSILDRLEKFIYTGDDRNICARYVEGVKIG
ncbi:guanine deaminase [Peptoclostridium litorale DSM 5388]|uniref:Guanine deaminase GuaD n=1 Tax=Peptoclostridium litorale DSM 5388 TaxID=1121324 RepID=A0A069RC44_PEPLI|nr:amidohydrolase family protein [Peptoclostridium litorale]KDR94358.1 guanine deaminase GuaD [Peptoclostridium litorale DSM 5388]SIO25214.1 guanine deaminase [Peptoclostridium litorale DSM 5388]